MHNNKKILLNLLRIAQEINNQPGENNPELSKRILDEIDTIGRQYDVAAIKKLNLDATGPDYILPDDFFEVHLRNTLKDLYEGFVHHIGTDPSFVNNGEINVTFNPSLFMNFLFSLKSILVNTYPEKVEINQIIIEKIVGFISKTIQEKLFTLSVAVNDEISDYGKYIGKINLEEIIQNTIDKIKYFTRLTIYKAA